MQSARERRQARIRQSGAERLAKITGSAGRDFQTEADARQLRSRASQSQLGQSSRPSSSEHSSLSTPQTSYSEHDDPPDVLPSELGSTENQFANDPLFQMLSQMQNKMGGSGHLPTDAPAGGFPFNLSDLVAEKTGTTNTAEETPAAKAQRQASHRFQVAVHFVIMIMVGLYSSWNPYSMLSIFVAVELILTLALNFSAPPAQPSMLSPFIVYLPAQLQRPVRLLLANRFAIRQAYRDFCLVLLVYGLLHAHDGIDASSIHYRVRST